MNATVFRRCLLCIVVFLGTVAAAAEPDAGRVEELLRKSGIWAHAGMLQAQVKAGAEQARRQGASEGRRPRLSDAEFERLIAAMSTAFAPERVRTGIAHQMAHALSADDVDEVLAWLSGDLGVRVAALEERCDRIEHIQLMREGRELLDAMPASRLALVNRLLELLHAEDAAFDTASNMMNAVVYGFTAMTPEADLDGAVEAMRRSTEAQRPLLVAYFHELLRARLAVAYKDLSEDELARYVAFNETTAARHYNAASLKVVGDVVVQASLDLGRQLGRELARKPRTL
ncbi:MAG TPA: hypothetical protein VNU21_11245 [Usitatibacter sp.]|jgi:hypothetical protein|nr:hypothetical protein [Usitatibacter sp.]